MASCSIASACLSPLTPDALSSLRGPSRKCSPKLVSNVAFKPIRYTISLSYGAQRQIQREIADAYRDFHFERYETGGYLFGLNRPRHHRRESLRGIPTKKGYDRDEYPPAMTDEGGRGASVRYIASSENRSAGGVMKGQLRPYCNEQRFVFERWRNR